MDKYTRKDTIHPLKKWILSDDFLRQMHYNGTIHSTMKHFSLPLFGIPFMILSSLVVVGMPSEYASGEITVPIIIAEVASTSNPAEENTRCSYNEGGRSICVNGTEGYTLQECATNEVCIQKGSCRVLDATKCVGPAPVVSTRTVPAPQGSNLGQLIESVFNFSLLIVGIAVFVMGVYGAFLMVLAGGFPEMSGRGKAIIQQAFMGALLLLSAYVILNTINPDFVKQRSALPTLPPQQAPK